MITACSASSLTCVVICVSFDLQLEKFGVDTVVLKQPATNRVFRAWVEDWEKDLLANLKSMDDVLTRPTADAQLELLRRVNDQGSEAPADVSSEFDVS